MEQPPFFVTALGPGENCGGYIFQGLLITPPFHPLMAEALVDASFADAGVMNVKRNYLAFCKFLFGLLSAECGRDPAPGWHESERFGHILLLKEERSRQKRRTTDRGTELLSDGFVIGEPPDHCDRPWMATRSWNWNHGFPDDKPREASTFFEAAEKAGEVRREAQAAGIEPEAGQDDVQTGRDADATMTPQGSQGDARAADAAAGSQSRAQAAVAAASATDAAPARYDAAGTADAASNSAGATDTKPSRR